MRFYTLGSTGYVDVRDVARIMVRLMESDITGEQFLVSSENLTFREFLELISASLKRRTPDIHANRFLTGLGWRFNALTSFITGREPIITRDNMRISHKYCLYSGQKIKDVLGYRYIPIKDSIQFLTEKYLNEV
jgi:nucleoside-diphosphate-sugar epimerase